MPAQIRFFVAPLLMIGLALLFSHSRAQTLDWAHAYNSGFIQTALTSQQQLVAKVEFQDSLVDEAGTVVIHRPGQNGYAFLRFTPQGQVDKVLTVGMSTPMFALGTNDTLYTLFSVGDSMDIDPGAGQVWVENQTLLAVYDSAWNYVASYPFKQGIYTSAFIEDICPLPTGGVVLTGYYSDSLIWKGNEVLLTSSVGPYAGHGFVLKIRSNGQKVFALEFEAPAFTFGSLREVNVLTCTPAANGDLLFTGTIPVPDSADLDPGAGQQWAAKGGFILRLNAAGQFVWWKPVVIPLNVSLSEGADGAILLAGRVWSSFDADPGPGLYLLNIGSWGNLVVIRLDAQGNFRSAIALTESSGCDFPTGLGIRSFADGSFETWGRLCGSTNLNPYGLPVSVIPPHLVSLGLLVQYDSTMQLQQYSLLTGTDLTELYDVERQDSLLYLSGTFIDSLNMELTGGTPVFLQTGDPFGQSRKVFIGKYHQAPLGTATPVARTPLSVFPNPAAGQAALRWTQSMAGSAVLTVFNAQGQRVQETALPGKQTGPQTATLNLADLPTGIYRLLLSSPDGQAGTTLVVE